MSQFCLIFFSHHSLSNNMKNYRQLYSLKLTNSFDSNTQIKSVSKWLLIILQENKHWGLYYALGHYSILSQCNLFQGGRTSSSNTEKVRQLGKMEKHPTKRSKVQLWICNAFAFYRTKIQINNYLLGTLIIPILVIHAFSTTEMNLVL